MVFLAILHVETTVALGHCLNFPDNNNKPWPLWNIHLYFHPSPTRRSRCGSVTVKCLQASCRLRPFPIYWSIITWVQVKRNPNQTPRSLNVLQFPSLPILQGGCYLYLINTTDITIITMETTTIVVINRTVVVVVVIIDYWHYHTVHFMSVPSVHWVYAQTRVHTLSHDALTKPGYTFQMIQYE